MKTEKKEQQREKKQQEKKEWNRNEMKIELRE